MKGKLCFLIAISMIVIIQGCSSNSAAPIEENAKPAKNDKEEWFSNISHTEPSESIRSPGEESHLPSFVEYDDWNEWKAAIQSRFKKQAPYFLPSDAQLKDIADNGHSCIEIVYSEPSEEKFEFSLYRNDTSFRILSEGEHRRIPHPHTVHDRFFHFSKTTDEDLDLSQKMNAFLAKHHSIRLEEHMEKIHRQLFRVKERFLIYQDENLHGLWQTSPGLSYTDEEKVAFFQKQHQKLVSQFPNIDETLVIAVQMAQKINGHFFFTIDRDLYKIETSIDSELDGWAFEIQEMK